MNTEEPKPTVQETLKAEAQNAAKAVVMAKAEKKKAKARKKLRKKIRRAVCKCVAAGGLVIAGYYIGVHRQEILEYLMSLPVFELPETAEEKR